MYSQSGLADDSTRVPIARDSIFRIYSMTKPITCVAILMLIERGLLHLEDPIEKYIPAFNKQLVVFIEGDENNFTSVPTEKSITIKDLMMHTSGITYGIFGAHPCDKIVMNYLKNDAAAWFRNTSLSDLCEAISNTPLMFQPGTKWHYGFSHDVLGYVIEIVSGMTLDAFFTSQIFQPLGMHDTDFHVPSHKLHRLVSCYELKGPNHGYIKSTSQERDRSNIPTMKSGGGGLVSTIDDYMIFCRSLLNGGIYNGVRILSESSVALLNTNHLPDGKDIEDVSFAKGFSETVGEGIGFGLGVSVVTKPEIGRGCSLSGIGEYGWGGAASTWCQIDPVKNVVTVFMTQIIPSSLLPMRSHLRWLSHWITEEKKSC